MLLVERLLIKVLTLTTVDIDDFEFADGGRVPFFRGKLVGKALGLAKRKKP